ncbi:MAG: hypothetical protein HC915_14385 [Anaerolineae bacterium]|nr:hypothetical protein [Anaerolineae bacterium]
MASTTTDADGYYRFDGLRPGGYVVRIANTNFVRGAVGNPAGDAPLANYLSSIPVDPADEKRRQ